MMNINHLSLSWSTSRGRDTYGYNICRLDDRNEGRRFKCMGGGYDMVGTVFAMWLEANYQKPLLALQGQASNILSRKFGLVANPGENRFYGMTHDMEADRINLDGACGLESMLRIAEAIGLEVEREYVKKGVNRGRTIGWYVSRKEAAV